VARSRWVLVSAASGRIVQWRATTSQGATKPIGHERQRGAGQRLLVAGERTESPDERSRAAPAPRR
jgi:hypothetical protein